MGEKLEEHLTVEVKLSRLKQEKEQRLKVREDEKVRCCVEMRNLIIMLLFTSGDSGLCSVCLQDSFSMMPDGNRSLFESRLSAVRI